MNESTKKAIVGISAAIVIGGVATGIAYFAGESQNYVAKVNGQTIKSAEYDKMFESTKKQYASRFGIDFSSEQGKAAEKDIKKGLVSQLVERQLIMGEAEKRHVTVDAQQIDAKLAEIKKGFPNDEAFGKALKDNGMTLDELKGKVREGLTVEGVVNDVTKDLKVADTDVKKYYEQNQTMYQKPEEVSARHILVKDEKKAKEILAKLKGGADFAKLAEENSEDPGSKTQGGDLGFFGRGRMVPEFEKAAFALKKDELSGLVKSQFGYHILKGGEHHAARTQPFTEVEKDIRENLKKERQQKEFGTWIAEQKKTAKVEYKTGFDPAADEAPAPGKGQPAPAQGQAAPTKGEPAPAQGQAAPTKGEPAPAQGQAAPAKGEPAPAAGNAPATTEKK